MTFKMIPLAKPYLGDEEIKAVEEVIISGMIAQGPKVEELEEKFKELCGVRHAVAVSSGTAALHTSLACAGIKKGDEVITTPFTFISTANSILMQNAIPVFADIQEDTFNINPIEIRKKITDKTKAILTVDLFGHLCDYDEIMDIAKENNLLVIADSCQSVNAELNGKKAGSFGSLAAFSFYATKNITSGEGGMITTDNADYAEKAKLFRQHSRSDMEEYGYAGIGYNYRMTDIAASVLLEQLKKLDTITKKRIENAEYLSKGLKNIDGIKVPVTKKSHKHVFHQYTVRIDDKFRLTRSQLTRFLNEKGIASAVYYPKPLHLIEHFRKLGYKEGNFPIAEKASRQVISLPVHPHLTKEDLNSIIDAIRVASKS